MPTRVLIVDDMLVNLRLLEGILIGGGFDVVTASSGIDCLAEINKVAPDIVLLDVMMPLMDGIEVCRQIRSNPKTANIPVIMVTALSELSDRAACLEAGADEFLTKPVNDLRLLAQVRALTAKKNSGI